MVAGCNNHEDDITAMIEVMQVLRGGEEAVGKLVAAGQRAVLPLREFILRGAPSHIFQPRQRAVQALAGLGAYHVLKEYLLNLQESQDPVIRFGEEAVIGTAARALAAWNNDEVFTILMGVARQKTLPGVIAALGSLRRREAAPLFIAALGDDLSREEAMRALMLLGSDAKPDLVAAITKPGRRGDLESPSSILKRRSALRILARMGWQAERDEVWRTLVDDPDDEVAAIASGMALVEAGDDIVDAALRRLLVIFSHPRWALKWEIKEILMKNAAVVRRRLEALMSDPSWSSPYTGNEWLMHVLFGGCEDPSDKDQT